MIPLFRTDGRSTCPMGMPMCQNRLAVPFWSYAMEDHPPKRIVEIGTYNGGFITALAVHAHQIGCRVVTYDRNAADIQITPLGHKLGVEYRTCDVWAAKDEIGALVGEPGVTFLLCDGGNKPLELETFSPFLKSGDVIAAHDYNAGPHANDWWPWCETKAEDGAKVAARHDLEPWMQEHFDMAGWLVYRKR